jgi:hypothetical protein
MAKIILRKPFAGFVLLLAFIAGFGFSANAQQSAAREWNEVLLEAIRKDRARPTIHARNLYHTSVVMWDAWAAYDETAQPVLLGNTLGDFYTPFEGIVRPEDPIALKEAREEAISYAMYRLLRFRFQNSPGVIVSYALFDATMEDMGYDTGVTSTDYSDGDPAKLGNYIAAKMIEFGLQDGSNEALGFSNQYYLPVNPGLVMLDLGNPTMVDPNRWQPLELEGFVDQGGNPFPTVPPFLSPEWGNVVPFSLKDEEMQTFERDGDNWNVYHDPGHPPYIDTTLTSGLEDAWKWGFILVALWQGHHDPTDGVMINIAPSGIGSVPVETLPQDFSEYFDFYDIMEGGVDNVVHEINPVTGLPYEPQMVPRGDYARVLAEFWADGPASETPPGHWFSIMHYVADHPLFEKRWQGEGDILDDLEWDVKAHLALGGAMHDAAVTCWAIKGYYDFVRPVSAIRFMAEKGQSSDPELPRFHPAGFPLIPGKIEQIQPGDPLAGDNNEFVNEIKIWTWLGPYAIDDIENDFAGVGWVLAKDWWPYQRPTFVSPPFAGYMSGHSTYSRTAAEVMTLITGDNYFPGGMGEFFAPQNEYLHFEDGPSVDVTLQWATYQDASDQCSLSRIWGGIHPPCDDIPGRLIGMELGPEAFDYAETFMNPGLPAIVSVDLSDDMVTDVDAGSVLTVTITYSEGMNPGIDPVISFPATDPSGTLIAQDGNWTSLTTYEANFLIADENVVLDMIDIRIDGAQDLEAKVQKTYLYYDQLEVDTQNPVATSTISDATLINDAAVGAEAISFTVSYDQAMDLNSTPVFEFNPEIANSLVFNAASSSWLNNMTYLAVFDAVDNEVEAADIDVHSSGATDINGNNESGAVFADLFSIDTQNPNVIGATPSVEIIADVNAGVAGFAISFGFDEPMDVSEIPAVAFPNGDVSSTLELNEDESGWESAVEFVAVYNVTDADVDLSGLEVATDVCRDAAGNDMNEPVMDALFSIDTKNPAIIALSANEYLLDEALVGDATFSLLFVFDDAMDTDASPALEFPELGAFDFTLTLNETESDWLNVSTYQAVFDVVDSNFNLEDVDVNASNLVDDAGNFTDGLLVEDFFSIYLDPVSVSELSSIQLQAYPNPVLAGDNLNIDFGGIKGTALIEVFANNGALVKSIQVNDVAGAIYQLNTAGMSSGIYMTRIINENQSGVFRFQISE